MIYVLIIKHAKFSYSSIESQVHAFFYKQHFYMKRQTDIGKKSRKS